jgi:hypothetical protein
MSEFASCEFHRGMPIVKNCPASYYLFQQTGRRLAIVPRKRRQCIRINDEYDLVVLDVKDGQVQLGVIGL